jgi:hypothetical protein
MPASFRRLAPRAPVLAERKVQLASAGISREQMQEPLAFDPPGLRIGELVFQHPLECVRAVRLDAAVHESGPALAASADKDP